jgi:hypothetical protein
MTYASIEEAWGGISGSSMLDTPVQNMSNNIHPMHKVRKETEQTLIKTQNNVENFTNQKPNRIKQFEQPQGGDYNCRYGDISCNQAYNNNLQFNNIKKSVSQGNQPFTPWSPQPQNYMFSPQYPWYPWEKQGYLNYGEDISNMMYNYPWMFYPDIARQIYDYQIKHKKHYNNIPIQMPYPPPPPNLWRNEKRKEHFTNTDNKDSNLIRNCLIIFVFFLIALSTLLVTLVIAMKN